MPPPNTDTSGFYPPHVTPAPKPLRFPFNVQALIRNNLELIPEQAYREPVVNAPGPPRMVFISGSEQIKALLQDSGDTMPKGHLQKEVLRPLFGNALHAVEGREWRWQRGAAAPLFRHRDIIHYVPVIAEAAEAAVEIWRKAGSGSVHPIDKDVIHATYQVISRTVLAGDVDALSDMIEEKRPDYFNGVNWWVIYCMFHLPHWLPRPGGRKMRAQESRIRDGIHHLVKERRRHGVDGDDLLARFMNARDPESGRQMSDELLVDNIVSFLISGFDTTALTLTWALYLISQSPEWEARMCEEIEQVAGSDPIAAEHVEKLAVVKQVLNEALRLYPAAPIIIRDIKQDMDLGGVAVKANTIGLIPIYAVHRHHEYWDNPNRFDPGRFDESREQKPSRYQFLPFGVGPRICIGAAFAMLEATIMLATFVRAARFETAKGFTPEPMAQMFLLPKQGMSMVVTLRS